MSYCRFSSDDWKCDVYVYEGNDGFVTHVARVRHVGETPIPAGLDLCTTTAEAWLVRHQEQMAWLHAAKLEPIGLPSDGETFTDSTPQECADRLEALWVEGYRVPQYVIDELRAEVA